MSHQDYATLGVLNRHEYEHGYVTVDPNSIKKETNESSFITNVVRRIKEMMIGNI